MHKWLLWSLTIVLLVVAAIFLIWAIQTAWLGSFPERDKAKYSMWAAWQLGCALVSALMPVGLWVWYWKRNRSGK